MNNKTFQVLFVLHGHLLGLTYLNAASHWSDAPRRQTPAQDVLVQPTGQWVILAETTEALFLPDKRRLARALSDQTETSDRSEFATNKEPWSIIRFKMNG